MKKKADWLIESCTMCLYLFKTTIGDAMCYKANKYLWLNGERPTPEIELKKGEKFSTYRYIPKWCPLEDF